jgi:hypothetical protein
MTARMIWLSPGCGRQRSEMPPEGSMIAKITTTAIAAGLPGEGKTLPNGLELSGAAQLHRT